MAVTIDGTNGVTFNDTSLQGAAASPYVLKNRIINGAMLIDQRNNGASVTAIDAGYTLDRWVTYTSQASKYTVQQNAGSITPPVGYTNYAGITSLSSYTALSTDYFGFVQYIEGYNISDLSWGTTSAKTITLSFLAYSSLTGTFSVALRNSAGNRSYLATYTISSANTWTQISVTIPGDITGTWVTNNGIGVRVWFDLGSGSSTYGTAGSWGTPTITRTSGSQSIVGTNGATFYITGVQLEIGSTATPFERRLYNQELANCQRYYWRWTCTNQTNIYFSTAGRVYSNTGATITYPHPVPMRTAPTTNNSANFGTSGAWDYAVTAITTNNGGYAGSPYLSANLNVTGTFATPPSNVGYSMALGSGSAGGSNTIWIDFSSEL